MSNGLYPNNIFFIGLFPQGYFTNKLKKIFNFSLLLKIFNTLNIYLISIKK